MVAVLRKYIRRFMMTERIMPRVWMYRRRWTPTLGVRIRKCTVRKRLANMRRWKCQLGILTLVRRTHALIIGNSQSNKEVHKETSTPRRSVWGFGYHLYCLRDLNRSTRGLEKKNPPRATLSPTRS